MAEQPKKQPLNDSNFITLAVSLSLIALVTAIIIANGAVKQIRLQNKVISKKNAAASQIKKNLENGRKLVAEYDKMSDATKDRIKNSLPINQDAGGMANMLESMSGQSGFVLKTISPDQPNEGDEGSAAPKPTDFFLSLEGNYGALTNFLRNVELASRPMSPSTIDIQGSTSALKVTLTMGSFFQGAADLSQGKETVQ